MALCIYMKQYNYKSMTPRQVGVEVGQMVEKVDSVLHQEDFTLEEVIMDGITALVWMLVLSDGLKRNQNYRLHFLDQLTVKNKGILYHYLLPPYRFSNCLASPWNGCKRTSSPRTPSTSTPSVFTRCEPNIMIVFTPKKTQLSLRLCTC